MIYLVSMFRGALIQTTANTSTPQLWGFRRDNPYKGTKRIVNYLIRLTIETGFATATTAIAELICFVYGRDNNLHLFL